ncbi:MAG TPA: serine/threonine-protein kinase, partial [Fimbriiglobus sp.]|nr:serine/threonine-protein kinase [Fimbriiglobus sp.]
HHPDTTNTDYELSASITAPPAVRFVEGRPAPTTALSPADRDQFRRRLMLCCLIAIAPFAFFTACAATNFIPLFGRDTVGWTGLFLSCVTLAGLVVTAAFLFRRRGLDEDGLRVLEVSVFGVMAMFFAYWQFQVLTAVPHGNGQTQQEQTAVLAAAAVVHVNWLLLIVFHGVLVPNTLARGVGVAAAMCAVAVAISLIAAFYHPPTGRHAGSLFTVAAVLLSAGTGLSVFGTAKTEALRREVETAREQVRQLGQYRLKKKLGHGGMGEVYLAEHQLLKRPCAIKRIHPRYLNNPEQVRRFEREVQATAQLRHPNTVEIYDYGRADDGTFYYVMEYLPGMSLEDMVVRHGPLPPERVVHILRQVCGALREAHKQGLVHRDIKPSNILVFPEGSPHDQAKLLDFGLVHSLYEEADPDAKITREGLIVGTPEYMSPEQASGGELDGRSDLFSLGTVAYYLLTGREAFHRENPMKTLLAVVNEDPAPVADSASSVPSDVAAVVKRCLAKSANDRYQRAGDLEIALLGSRCAGEWTEARAAEWWAGHPEDVPGDGTDLNSLPLRDSSANGKIQ